ncbi:MAG: thiamine pyrophosphate-binding protein [Acidobacteriota bacterium]|nr:thiamine pyrophosphate-binding protein [Acidobacteriota bacterium]
MAKMTGGDAAYHALRALGVDCVFGIVSVHNIPIYDAIRRHGGIRTIDARHEQAAVHMADGFARTTGGLGVAITSTGPGAANAMSGLYEAQFASSPVMMITGQIDSAYYGKGKGFVHEAERQVDMLSTVTKHTASVGAREEIATTILSAGTTAQQGRPGPVAVEIPIDMQYRSINDEPATPPTLTRRRADPAAVAAAADVLAASQRRVIVAGGGINRAGAHRELAELARALEAPIFTTVNGRGAISEDDPLAMGVLQGPPLGGPQIQEALASAEVVLAVATRFQAHATSLWQLAVPRRLIHLDVDPSSIGRNYPAEATLVADAAEGLQALADAADWQSNDDDFNQSLFEHRARHRQSLRERIGPDHEMILDAIRHHLPADGCIVRDATVPAYTWGNQLLSVRQPRTSIHPTSSAIGPGLPSAIGAALASGEKTVLLQGDGGFMLHIGELATAAQYAAPIVICLFNDGGYGVLRHIQNATFDGRTTGVDLHTPDFTALAHAMGLNAERVGAAVEFEPAFERAIAAEGPVLLEIDMSGIEPIQLRIPQAHGTHNARR